MGAVLANGFLSVLEKNPALIERLIAALIGAVVTHLETPKPAQTQTPAPTGHAHA